MKRENIPSNRKSVESEVHFNKVIGLNISRGEWKVDETNILIKTSGKKFRNSVGFFFNKGIQGSKQTPEKKSKTYKSR